MTSNVFGLKTPLLIEGIGPKLQQADYLVSLTVEKNLIHTFFLWFPIPLKSKWTQPKAKIFLKKFYITIDFQKWTLRAGKRKFPMRERFDMEFKMIQDDGSTMRNFSNNTSDSGESDASDPRLDFESEDSSKGDGDSQKSYRGENASEDNSGEELSRSSSEECESSNDEASKIDSGDESEFHFDTDCESDPRVPSSQGTSLALMVPFFPRISAKLTFSSKIVKITRQMSYLEVPRKSVFLPVMRLRNLAQETTQMSCKQKSIAKMKISAIFPCQQEHQGVAH